MTEVVIGIEQLLGLLEDEDIEYVKTEPGVVDPHYGIIETPNGIMTWRRLE